jgi:hypothetical protein
MFSRALLLPVAGASLALSVAGCGSLTRPNEISVAGETAVNARAKPPSAEAPAPAPAERAAPTPPVRP